MKAPGFRVRVLNSLELLISSGVYCGFILSKPIDKLIPFCNEKSSPGKNQKAPDGFTNLLKAYLNIAEEHCWELFDEGDKGVEKKLLDIIGKLNSYSDDLEPVCALKDRCYSLLD